MIDQKAKDITGIRAYCINDDLPKVDLTIITLQNNTLNIDEIDKLKKSAEKVIELNETFPEFK